MFSLKKRIEELEKRIEVLEQNKAAEAMQQAGKLFQEGLDNIMAYQWPPKKGDET